MSTSGGDKGFLHPPASKKTICSGLCGNAAADLESSPLLIKGLSALCKLLFPLDARMNSRRHLLGFLCQCDCTERLLEQSSLENGSLAVGQFGVYCVI